MGKNTQALLPKKGENRWSKLKEEVIAIIDILKKIIATNSFAINI